MTDPAPAREPREETDAPPPTPRWVKRLSVVAVLLMLLFALLHVSDRGFGHHMHGGPAQTSLPSGSTP